MKKRINIKKLIILIVILLIIITGIIFLIYKIRSIQIYHGTYEYKLLNKGYTQEEISLLEKHYSEDELYSLAIKEKDETRLKLLENKFYKEKNYDRYRAYLKNNKSSEDEAILMVNINRDFNFYEKTSLAKIEKNNLILVNKYFKLESTFVPTDLVTISPKYSWGSGKQIKKEVYNAFLEMHEDASKEDIYLMINLGYRSYDDQEALYNKYEKTYGTYEADKLTARPGFSEHQSGLALDIFEINNSNYSTFKNTQACKWLKENAYKYGFILRYTEDTEKITGFSSEDWHYRYVGKNIAKLIFDNNITLEEYYYNNY